MKSPAGEIFVAFPPLELEPFELNPLENADFNQQMVSLTLQLRALGSTKISKAGKKHLPVSTYYIS
ncbi:MAG: hypothetical protein R3281_10070 [Balneolaceae bacterium]|nr:hypothetical protein [Balneolaceae bacterium]